ncbi:hypothetical protein NAL32_17700 [Chryseobacterium sp. Ch-15]|uniref:MetA-pathway of phenol degradation n=1 Tax=Chryseobacterium muglaense TaxID=2893752 RepID=A0A9Q3UVA6_9FLAO|nr:hypothetical protein [Chryseobacterium muglaense]MBD3906514.1 hypothetical protein [Chryseobacterium muglaense]MCC9034019.1 hypothetical protein [Chryseobacterium muglaense]MCM2556222.1 hypothetical protein [Chryseobacterium muglaense]
MKKLYFFLLLSSTLHAQSTFSFKEKIHLKKINNQYFSQSNRNPLQFVNKNEKITIPVKTFTSSIEDDSKTFYEINTVVDYQKAKIFVTDSLDIQYSKLSGELFLEDNKLLFYPRLEEKEDLKYDKFIRNHSFFFDLPERSSLDVHYSSWHIGVLTLPVKAYLKSRSDSVKNNVILAANLNVMFGKKWGTKRYYNSPGSREDKVSTKSWSMNAILGITRVELDIYNTTPQIGSIKTNVTNLSYGLAVGYQLDKFGLFLATGIDSPLSSLGKNWNFSNKPWIGLGLGLGFW